MPILAPSRPSARKRSASPAALLSLIAAVLLIAALGYHPSSSSLPSGAHPQPRPSSSPDRLKARFEVQMAASRFWKVSGTSGTTTYWVNATPTGPHTFDEYDKDTNDGVSWHAERYVRPGQRLSLKATFEGIHRLYTLSYISCIIFLKQGNGPWYLAAQDYVGMDLKPEDNPAPRSCSAALDRVPTTVPHT